MASGYLGVLISDPWLQNQFTQLELRSLKTQFQSMREEGGGAVTLSDLASKFSPGSNLASTVETPDCSHVDFEIFLRIF